MSGKQKPQLVLDGSELAVSPESWPVGKFQVSTALVAVEDSVALDVPVWGLDNVASSPDEVPVGPQDPIMLIKISKEDDCRRRKSPCGRTNLGPGCLIEREFTTL